MTRKCKVVLSGTTIIALLLCSYLYYTTTVLAGCGCCPTCNCTSAQCGGSGAVDCKGIGCHACGGGGCNCTHKYCTNFGSDPWCDVKTCATQGDCGGTCPRDGTCNWCTIGGSDPCGGTHDDCEGVGCGEDCPGPCGGVGPPSTCRVCPTYSDDPVCMDVPCGTCLTDPYNQAHNCPAPGGHLCPYYCSCYIDCPREQLGKCPGPDLPWRDDCLCHCGGEINASWDVCQGLGCTGKHCGLVGDDIFSCEGLPETSCCHSCSHLGVPNRHYGYDCIYSNCKRHCNDWPEICSTSVVCNCNNGQTDPCDSATIPNHCRECTGVVGAQTCPSPRSCDSAFSW